MRKSFKVVLVLWAIAMVAWIVVMVANIRVIGWEIIGPRDIWPMALATVVMLACVLTERRNNSKASDSIDTDAAAAVMEDGDGATVQDEVMASAEAETKVE